MLRKCVRGAVTKEVTSPQRGTSCQHVPDRRAVVPVLGSRSMVSWFSFRVQGLVQTRFGGRL